MNNSTYFDLNTLCTMFYIIGILNSIYRYFSILIILIKILLNHKFFLQNKIFLLYFTILIIGNILLGCSESLLSIACKNNFFAMDQRFDVANTTSNPVNSTSWLEIYKKANVLTLFGYLLVNFFFGLIPNFLYSLYKTRIDTTINTMTMRYFKINIFISVSFFIIIFIMNILLIHYQYGIIIVFILELLYNACFYIHVLINLHKNLNNSKLKKSINIFFIYFISYFFIQIFLWSMFMTLYLNKNINMVYSIILIIIICDNIANVVLMVIILLYLKDVKFKVEQSNTKSMDALSQKKDASTFCSVLERQESEQKGDSKDGSNLNKKLQRDTSSF
jgi:hypothetical protein